MANRYWVGGTATWDLTAGSKWSATSGGAGGASVPTGADAVFFDANSGSGTVTLSLFSQCASINTSGFTGTLSSSNSLSITGSVTIGAGTTWNIPGLGLSGTGTLTTNGKNPGVVGISDGSWSLGDALTADGFSVYGSASFNTNNYNITAASVSFTNTSNVTLGSSLVTVTGSDVGGAVFEAGSGITLNAGTSTIKFTDSTSNTKTFDGGGKTYNIVWFAPGAGTGYFDILGANTFNELKDDGSAAHTIQFPTGVTQTIATFNVNGTSGQRISLRSATNGTQFTLSKASGTVNVDYLDIKDSNAAGGATWNAGAGSLNSGNNSGWVFPVIGFSFGVIIG
jgi:hypothetical protein